MFYYYRSGNAFGVVEAVSVKSGLVYGSDGRRLQSKARPKSAADWQRMTAACDVQALQPRNPHLGGRPSVYWWNGSVDSV